MSRIITISRQFGSGGREIGKRLAESMGIAYFDKEIITAIAEKSSFSEEYVHSVVENHISYYYPITIAKSFSIPYDQLPSAKINQAQYSVIQEMAAQGDCVIVGRCSDYILRELHPINIFVYADIKTKIARCRSRAGSNEDLSENELKKRIRNIDKSRAKYYETYTGQQWGEKENYNLCVNTSGLKSLKEFVLKLNHFFI